MTNIERLNGIISRAQSGFTDATKADEGNKSARTRFRAVLQDIKSECQEGRKQAMTNGIKTQPI